MEETGLIFAQDGCCQLRPTNGCGATVIQCVCDSELDKLGLEPGESLVEGFGDWKVICQGYSKAATMAHPIAPNFVLDHCPRWMPHKTVA